MLQNRINHHCPIDRPRRPSHGYLLIEMLIALAFMAMATGVVVKMHQARLDYDRNEMDRLAEQLRVENVGEQLSVIPTSEFPGIAARFAEESKVKITIDPFASDAGKGWHVRIASESEHPPRTHHVWRLETQP